jgi:cytochrome P450
MKALPLAGHSPWFHADTSGFLLRLARSSGDVARFRLGRTDAFLLSHPDHVRRVLVDDADAFRKGGLVRRARRLLGDGLITSEGELHRTQRRRVQPAFARRELATYGETVPNHAARIAARWRDGDLVDIGAAMDELALAVVVHVLLGGDVEHGAGAIAADLRLLARWFPLLALPGAERLEHAGVPPFAQAGLAAARIDLAVRRHIQDAAEEQRGDLLSMLLESGGDPMPPGLVRDEVMTLFLAGHDTTAAALTWTWYLLAANPAAAERVRAEIAEVLGDRDPVPADCAALTYTGMVFDEVIRLYPPVGRIGRRPIDDYHVGGQRIRAGSAVFLSPYVTQRDSRWWPDPERFDPDRWQPQRVGERPRYSAFPFGAGPRSCVGGHLARMIGTLTIATVARRWRMAAPEGPPPRIRSLLTLKPRRPLVLRVLAHHPLKRVQTSPVGVPSVATS